MAELDAMPCPTWAAMVEGYEEDGFHAGETRDEALTEAMTRLLEDQVEPGWAEPGRYAVEVLSGCTWHERCDDESCEFCTSDDRFEMWLEARGGGARDRRGLRDRA